MSGNKKRALVVALVVTVAWTVLLRRLGYRVGTSTVVRCRSGHLFTTVWIPGASFKSIRLGFWRVQRCPVGRHWSLVAPVREAALSDEERAEAAEHRDVRIP